MLLKCLVLWITAGGTDLDETKAISCRSRAWRSVQDLMWDVVETRIVVSSELSVLQELVETESAQCPLGIATALAIFGAFQPIDDYLDFLEEILQDILTILPTDMLSILLKSEFPFFGALDWLSDHQLWGSKSNVGCLDHGDGMPVHSRQFQAVLRHHLDGPKGTPPLPTIAAVEFLMKQGSKERMESQKGQGMGGNSRAVFQDWLDCTRFILKSYFPTFSKFDAQEHLRKFFFTCLFTFAFKMLLIAYSLSPGLPESRQCFTGKGVATLTFLLTYSERFVIESSFTEEALQLLAKAEVLLREETMEPIIPIEREKADERKQRHLPPVLDRLLNPEWKASKVLHEISRKVRDAVAEESEKIKDDSEEDHQDCLILIYTFPTEEIRQDTREALGTLEENFVSPLELHERPKIVVFVDEATEALLDEDLRPFTSLQIVPAIIPKEELTREMKSYSCQDGSNCVSGEEMPMDFHRGNVNQTQFWSPAYLRISRYTAGPLFQHPQLDSCDQFLKIDTDFFFTSPIDRSPFKKMREAGARLAWWQMHVQGQRQTGYIEAALNFLEASCCRSCAKGWAVGRRA